MKQLLDYQNSQLIFCQSTNHCVITDAKDGS